jgi:WD40 repeat protein
VLETVGNIIAIKYAPSGDYIAIGSEEGKCIVYDPKTEQKEKCRPGHQGDIYSIALSKSGLYLATIGKDKNVLINKIVMGDKPQEVARYTITNL